MKLKAIIQSLDSKKGYIVTTNDGREFIVKNILIISLNID